MLCCGNGCKRLRLFQTTSGRFSKIGSTRVIKGGGIIGPSLGPMARDVDSLVTVLRHIWSPGSLNYLRDAYTAPLTFQGEPFCGTKKLRIGYYTDNGYFQVMLSCSVYSRTSIIGTPSVGAKSFQLSNCANYGMLSYFVSV